MRRLHHQILGSNIFFIGYAENATLANGFLDPGTEMITRLVAVEAFATKIRAMIQDG